MTVQPADIEPEEQRSRSSDWRHDPNFVLPERVPWSHLSGDVMEAWGRANPSDPQPEHMEIIGQTGSGKTYLLIKLLQDRYTTRKSAAVMICTKIDDAIFRKLGWPVVSSIKEVDDNPNCIYWPQTKLTGTARREFHDQRLQDLLKHLWAPQANRIVAFDEIGYAEGLSGEMRAMIQMYWREGRSAGITVVGMKQRPQGAMRDMHSESLWTVAFKPKDRADLERWAELFGSKRDYMPVFDSLDRGAHEFIIANPIHEEAYISWVDTPLTPQKVERKGGWYAGRATA